MADTTEQAVWQALRDVIEPDLGENIVDLGLVYAVRVGPQSAAHIDLCMTTQHGPHADAIAGAVQRACDQAGAATVEVRLVSEPVWTPYRMAEPLRALLGLPASEPEPPGQTKTPALWRHRLRRRLARS